MKSKPRGPKKTFESERKIQQRKDRIKMMDKTFENTKKPRGPKGPSPIHKSYDHKGGFRGGKGTRGRR